MQTISLVLLVLWVASSAVAAKQSRFRDLMQPLDLFAAPKGTAKLMKMTELYQAIAKNGISIKLAKDSLETAELDNELTYDTFNIPKPTLSSSYKYSKTSNGSPSYERVFSLGLSVGTTTDWGLAYKLDLPQLTHTHSRAFEEDSVTDTFKLGVASLSFALLKGSVFTKGRSEKDSADMTLQNARWDLKNTAIQALTKAEQAFFDVILKQAKVRVLEQALSSSQALYEDVAEMIKAGEADRLSAIKVELQVATTETDLLVARSDLTSSIATLNDLLSLDSGNNNVVYPDPSEVAQDPAVPNSSIGKVLEIAKKQRPDYLALQLKRKQSELALKTAFSNNLPALNLTATYGFEASRTTLSEAANAALRFPNPQYSVGIEFVYSFFNDREKTDYAKARINQHKSDIELQQSANTLLKEISSAFDAVQLGKRRLGTSRMAKELSEKKLKAEFEKFRVGESNIRNIVDFQADLNNARIAEVTARIDLRKSLSALNGAIGEFPEGVKFKHD